MHNKFLSKDLILRAHPKEWMLLCALQSGFDKATSAYIRPNTVEPKPQFSINLTDLSFNVRFKRFYIRYGRREIAVRQSRVADPRFILPDPYTAF